MGESANPRGVPDLGAPRPDEFERTLSDLERFRAGDRSAFDALWGRYGPGLEILVRGRLRRRLDGPLRAKLDAEVNDILQEIACVAIERLREVEYRGPGSLLAWLSRVGEYVVHDRTDYWRAGKRSPVGEKRLKDQRDGSSSAGFQPRAPGPGASTLHEIAEHRKLVAAAMATLSERHHAIVHLSFFGGAGWAEVAREVGSPSADAVRMECYSRALPALAAALATERRRRREEDSLKSPRNEGADPQPKSTE